MSVLQELEDNLPMASEYKSKGVSASPIRVIRLLFNSGVWAFHDLDPSGVVINVWEVIDFLRGTDLKMGDFFDTAISEQSILSYF